MDVDISLDYGLTLLAALLIGTGFVLQQQSARREPASRFLSLQLITDLLHQPRWLAGIAFMIAGQVLAAWSIGHLSLAFVEPLLTTNLVFALVLAVPIAKASLRVWEIFGAAVLCTGVALLSASRSAKPIGLSFGSVSHWPAAAVIAAIAFAAVQAGRRRPGRLRAMLTGHGRGPRVRHPGRADQADAADPRVERYRRDVHHLGAVRARGRGRDRDLADAERVQRRAAAALAAGHRGG